MTYSVETASFLTDTTEGRDTALIEAHTVLYAQVVEEGVLLLLTTGARFTLPCNKEQAARTVQMIADVKESQVIDRTKLESKGDPELVDRKAIFLAARDPAQPRTLGDRRAERNLEERIYDMSVSRGKIPAIKLHRELTGSGLKDAKDYVEELIARRDTVYPT